MSRRRDETAPHVDPFDRAVAARVLAMGWPDDHAPEWRRLASSLLEATHALWRRGHAALPLAAAPLLDAGLPAFAEIVADPSLPQVVATLLELRLAADGRGPMSPAPFVLDLDDGGRARRLYPARTYRAERTIADRLGTLIANRPPGASPEFVGRLSGLLGADSADDQSQALTAALGHRVTVVAGGPGSGKTWLAARILAALAWQRRRADGAPLAVLAAAPTGKAAARFQESLHAALLGPAGDGIATVLGDDAAAILSELAVVRAQTIHRAVGWGRETPIRRLDADVVVVDEGSMVDLEVMAALLEAMPDGARLIILGDTAQLASVAAGTVFSDLAAAGNEGGLLAGRVTTLTRSRRFPPASDLGAVAAAMQALEAGHGDASTVFDQLVAATRDVRWSRTDLEDGDDAPILDHLAERYRALSDEANVARRACGSGGDAQGAARHLLRLIGAARVLTPYREGRWGVIHLNQAIGHRVGGGWSPLLVTRNDYGIGLMNGDLGIRFDDVAWFVDADGVRAVPTALLPQHEPAWAMTIHKSQGSEYDHVAVVLPPRAGQGRELLTRELLFTALTRARLTAKSRQIHLEIFADEDTLRAALVRRAVRFGGLRPRLGIEA